MLKNTRINLGVIRIIATALGELNERVVYVGGAVVSLYINDPAAEDVRPTKDIDIISKIISIKKSFIYAIEFIFELFIIN